MPAIAERLQRVRERIAAAAAASGRSAESVRLVAVSKRQPLSAIRALAELGVRDFGESQVQEASEKIPALAGLSLDWHFVGHLQSNKTRHIGALFGHVHTIDSIKLVRRLADSERPVPLQLLLQVNVAADPAKHGLNPVDVTPLIDQVLTEAPPGVELRGLMTIGYRDASDDDRRRGFAALRELRDQLEQRFGARIHELSMGMSDDYALAIEEGATLVRVGTGLFGERS